MVLEKTLKSPWTARRSNQSILKEISPEYSLERLMLKLKLQYFGHLMRRVDSLEKTLMLGKIEGRRRRDKRGWDDWMASLIQWTWVWARSGSCWWQGSMACCSPWVTKSWTRLSNWTELKADTVHEEKLLYISLFLKTTLFTSYFNTHPQSMLHRDMQ